MLLESPPLRSVGEAVDPGVVEVVGLAELMEQPHHLVGVTGDVRREARSDQQIDGDLARPREVEQAPGQRRAHDLLTRIPLEGKLDDFGCEAASRERTLQSAGVPLRPSPLERHLSRRDDYPWRPHREGSGRYYPGKEPCGYNPRR